MTGGTGGNLEGEPLTLPIFAPELLTKHFSLIDHRPTKYFDLPSVPAPDYLVWMVTIWHPAITSVPIYPLQDQQLNYHRCQTG